MKRICSMLLVLCLMLGLCACGQKADTEVSADTLTWQEQYDLGIRYLSEGNYEAAIIAFTAAIEIDPKQADAYIGLADIYIAQGNRGAAIKVLKDALDAVGESEELRQALETASIIRQERGDGGWFTQEYDETGRLIRMTHYDADGSLEQTIEYTYDETTRTELTTFAASENGMIASILSVKELETGRVIEQSDRTDKADGSGNDQHVWYDYNGIQVTVTVQYTSHTKEETYFPASDSVLYTMVSPENMVSIASFTIAEEGGETVDIHGIRELAKNGSAWEVVSEVEY